MVGTTLRALLRTLVLAVALMVGAAVAAALLRPSAAPPRPDDPLGAGAAFLVVSLLGGAVMAALAAHARFRGARLALALFVVAFGAQTVLTQIETVIFNASVQMDAGTLARVVLVSAISFACAAAVVPFLVRGPPEDDAYGAEPPPVREVAWRLALVAVGYVAVYFAAGAGIAWRSAAVRDYYADGAGGPGRALLVALQLGRGALWGALALVGARALKPDRATVALLCAVTFSVLVAAPLLYPNPYMPWPVRRMHLLEVGLSNALFGAFAGWTLGPRVRRRRPPVRVARPAPAAPSPTG